MTTEIWALLANLIMVEAWAKWACTVRQENSEDKFLENITIKM